MYGIVSHASKNLSSRQTFLCKQNQRYQAVIDIYAHPQLSTNAKSPAKFEKLEGWRVPADLQYWRVVEGHGVNHFFQIGR